MQAWASTGRPLVLAGLTALAVLAGPSAAQAFRVTEYCIGGGSCPAGSPTFLGTTLNLTLNQNLAPDYFVIIQGADGDGGQNTGVTGPDENYVSLTAAPAGTPGVGGGAGDLAASGAPNRITLTRNNSVFGWVGVVTVVECTNNCDTDGFRLRDVRRVSHPAAPLAVLQSGTDTASPGWTNVNQVLLMGGFNGAGCDTAAIDTRQFRACHVRLFPSGTGTINWTRDLVRAAQPAATSTVMAVEWGSAWGVQNVRVQGSNRGGGVDAVGEYNNGAIGPVARDRTWVWGTGHTQEDGLGNGAEGAVITLGDGVTQNATESLVSVGLEGNPGQADFQVWALTHPAIAVDHVFKPDGHKLNLIVDVTVDAATSPRMALSYNSLEVNADGEAPRHIFSARYTADRSIRLERRRWDKKFTAWVQGIQFPALSGTGSGTQPSGVIVPTGRQDYFVLGYEQHVWNMMERVRTGEGGPAFSSGMESVVSAVASADGQVIIYDHWEDSFEPDPWVPLQPSTLVLGDGNSANGRACEFTNDPRLMPCPAVSVDPVLEDTMYRGTPITLNSDQGLGAGCTAGVRCTVPVNPRGTATRFDGGDRLVTSGGPLALIHNQFPPPYPQIGGSTEVLSRQAFAGATSYFVPAGEDRYAFGGPFQMFQYTALNIVAFDDNTQVFINSPGATGGTVSFTLSRGQHYTNCLTYGGAPLRCTGGAIDGTPAAGLTINAATKISSTGPIAILLFSGGDGTWATDFMPILPDLLHGNDYILPAPGDNPAQQGFRPLNVYLYNPDSVSAITVTASDRTPRTNNIALAASATADYRSVVGDVPAGSTVRLTSNKAFWGFALHDHLSAANDWGYSWLASNFLTNAYTVSFAPGVDDAAANSATSAARQAISGDAQCTIPPPGPGQCDSINRSPAFVSASLDSTLVKVDFNNDGIFDLIDVDSDDYPDNGVADDGTCGVPAPPWNVPGANSNCLYRIDALQSLRIFDYTDYDNTGTRVLANKPIAMAYGQDTDQATGPDPILDTGYTVYPLSQRFLDPVLVVGKVASPTSVAGATGGQTTFTITVQSYAFAPLTNLTVTDLLPMGLGAADYAGGSTRIIYPDLSQSATDPTSAIDPPTGRTRLSWTLSPNSLGPDQRLTIAFAVNIPAGPARIFANETFATGVYAGRTFSAVGGADVVRANVSLTKLATDDGAPEPGDVLTYTLVLTNALAETNVRITDAIPPNTTFVTGSITASAPFAGAYDALQNAVVYTAANLAANTTATLTFQVRINPNVPVGTLIRNQGIYESNETPSFLSNETRTTVVGPNLTEFKTIVGGVPPSLTPLELVTFEVQVRNTGAGSAANLRITDALALSRTTYVAGTMQYSINGAAFIPVTDAADADAGTLSGTTVQLLLASLAPSADVRFRFQARVNAGTGGQVMNNQATVSANQQATADTNLVQVPIVGNAIITGRVFRDVNGNGSTTVDPGEPGLPNISVRITNSLGITQTVVTDANGDFTVVVPAGATTIDVDDTDPDFPPGSVLSTANDPQTVTAVASSTVASANIGYRTEPLTISKTVVPAGSVLPGQTLSYTVTVRNNSAVTQTGFALDDTLPPGTSYVAGSATVSYGVSTIRATEYYIPPGTFTGTTYDLPISPISLPLAADYFVIIEGSDGSGGSGTDTTPSQDLVALTGAPTAFGGLVSTGANTLRLTRNGTLAGGSWVGVVKVVECLSNCTTGGFLLRDARRVTHLNATVSGTDTSTTPWSNINQVMLVGGQNGAGCNSTDTDPLDHKNCHVRLFPSGTQTINWTRDTAGASSLATATSTVMVVEWGSEWTVQRRAILNGNNGGGDVDVAGEYNNVAINPVSRVNTWVWGTGHTNDGSVGESADGVILTLGNGVVQNASESIISAGSNYSGRNINFDVYALTHPSLRVSHAWRPSGGPPSTLNLLTTLVTPVTEVVGNRFALVYNSTEGNNNDYSTPLLSSRYLSPIEIQLERRRFSDEFAAWTQGIDLSAFLTVSNVVCANSGATCNDPTFSGGTVIAAGQGPGGGFTIPPAASLVFTYQARVNDPPPSGQPAVVNTATTSTTENPTARSATVTTPLLVPRVDVEPNDAGYANAGTTISFRHVVRNVGSEYDSYAMTVTGERGWLVDLIDPASGVILASDLNADGIWDAGTPPVTGTLAPGAIKEYQVRIWVPGGATPGTQETVRLRATSSLAPTTWDDAKDEVTVLPGTLGSVIVTPDNSGVVQAGSYTAYSHRVINNTALDDTFDLRAPGLGSGTGVDSSQGWTNTIHWDTNGDGVYTPGTDLQILNTAQLPPGGSQLIFVVVNAPAGTPAGTRDVSHLTAWSRNDVNIFGAATDTSTVVTTPAHDLSGGGSRVVAAGDTAVFPGTIINLGGSADRFEFTLTPASLYGVDNLLHPTELWVDTNADGIPDTRIATDTNGDGIWDVPPPAAWDADGDGLPDALVAGGGAFAYELRRAVDANQRIQRDFVTLSTRSVTSPATDPDNVTATWIFAAATRAGIRGFRVGEGEVTFATSVQSGTASFVLYQTDDPSGATGREPLHAAPVLSPVPDAITPIVYTVATRAVEKRYLMIEETETDGDKNWIGPFRAGDARLRRALELVEQRLDQTGVPQGPVRRVRGFRQVGATAHAGEALGRVRGARNVEGWRRDISDFLRGRRPRTGRQGVKIEVAVGGVVELGAEDLTAAGLSLPGPAQGLSLTHLGAEVPHQWQRGRTGAWRLSFEARGLATDYSNRAPYVLTRGAAPAPAVPLTSSADPVTPGFVRVERNVLYVPSVPAGAAPWLWDLAFGGYPWPDPGWDPAAGDFELPELAPGAAGPVPVRLRVVGYTNHRHALTATINGLPVGSLSFEGTGAATLEGSIPAEALRASGNQLELGYTGDVLPASPDGDSLLYFDYLELALPVVGAARAAEFALVPYDATLALDARTEYLIVTHPAFEPQAQRIAERKRREGLAVAVLDTERIYDRYSAGVVEPLAIRAAIRAAAAASQRLRYVLLVGDDSFDPLDHAGRGVPSFLPSLFARDSGWGLVPSENLYADLDDDGRPDLAIGRLPVRTPQQAAAMAEKIVGQAEALRALAQTHLAVTDNSNETDSPFRAEAESALQLLTGGAPVRWADLADGGSFARAALLAGWQDGTLGTHYFGHGGLTEWADEQVLTVADVEALGAGWKPTVLFTWACLSQYNLGVDGPSLNEALVLLPRGGALASFGPAGISAPAHQAPLVGRVYDALREPGVSLGEAIRRAKAATLEAQPNAQEAVVGFNLFGDPALVLPQAEAVPR